MTVMQVAATVPMGLSAATAVRVGTLLGAGQPRAAQASAVSMGEGGSDVG